MRRHRKALSKGDERVLLSDVLPFELPVSFSNEQIARYLGRLDIRQNDKRVTANNIGAHTKIVLFLIFGRPIQNIAFLDNGLIEFDDPGEASVPLVYNVNKSPKGVRRISLMHPRSQMEVAKFYGRYSDTILYFTSRSAYSIRHPRDVARWTVFRDAVFREDVDRESGEIEEVGREYEALRSYFTYAGYSQLNRFYDSSEFRLLERRYSWLVHVDITRNFDSLYTHSISWVTNGLETSKIYSKQCGETFGGQFDSLMQMSNNRETHGILIGAEISRIFSEIILQEVDVRISRTLQNQGINLGTQYEIRRYVDDYFIFCDSTERADTIVATIGEALASFKLYLNDAKTTYERTPLKSAVSVAKAQIMHAFQLGIKVENSDGFSDGVPRLAASSRELLLAYRAALLDSEVDDGAVASYALSRVEIESEHALSSWASQISQIDSKLIDDQVWSSAAKFIKNVIDVAISVYSAAPTASRSVILSRIVHTMLRFIHRVNMPFVTQRTLESKIATEVSVHIRRAESEGSAPMHGLILLDCLASIRSSSAVSEAQLRSFVGLNTQNGTGPDALVVMVALRYCATHNLSLGLQDDLVNYVISELDQYAERLERQQGAVDTNCTLMAAGLLSFPNLPMDKREHVLSAFDLDDASGAPSEDDEYYFRWEMPDYYEVLQRKRGGAVY